MLVSEWCSLVLIVVLELWGGRKKREVMEWSATRGVSLVKVCGCGCTSAVTTLFCAKRQQLQLVQDDHTMLSQWNGNDGCRLLLQQPCMSQEQHDKSRDGDFKSWRQAR